MIHYLSLILTSAAFLLLGLVGLLDGSTTGREILGDLQFLWGPGRDGDVYYGVQFTDD